MTDLLTSISSSPFPPPPANPAFVKSAGGTGWDRTKRSIRHNEEVESMNNYSVRIDKHIIRNKSSTSK